MVIMAKLKHGVEQAEVDNIYGRVVVRRWVVSSENFDADPQHIRSKTLVNFVKCS